MMEDPYQEKNESYPPKAVACHEDFCNIQNALIDVGKELSEAISPTFADAPGFKQIADAALKFKTISNDEKLLVNIVGPSGNGKSHTINSILGVKAAASGASGQACTQVPTSYEGAPTHQTTAFAAKIEFYSNDDIKTKLETLIRKYREYVRLDRTSSDRSEMNEFASSSSTAVTVIHTMMRKRLECATEAATKAFLAQDINSIELPIRITATLMHWVTELKTEANNDLTFATDDLASLNAHVKGFASQSRGLPGNSTEKKISLWPLVKIVRLTFKDIPALKYASITDWPGSNDTNQLRAGVSTERAQDCDLLLVVASADRIASNRDMYDLLSLGDAVPRAVICTKIDDQYDSELLRSDMEDQGYDFAEHDALSDQEKELSKDIKALKKQLGSPRHQNKRPRLSEDAVATEAHDDDQLRDERARKKMQRYKVRQERADLRVGFRKQYIKSLLKEEISRQDLKQPDDVLFAANVHYDGCKASPDERKEKVDPCFSPAATGIPDIRRYIYETASLHLVTKLKSLMDHATRVLLPAISGITNPTGGKDRQSILRQVKDGKDRVPDIVSSRISLIEATLDGRLNNLDTEQLKKYQSEAVQTWDLKGDWSASSLRAFIGQKGTHKTPIRGEENWNQQFFEPAATDIRKDWPPLAKELVGMVDLTQDLVLLPADVAKGIESKPELARVSEIIKGKQHDIDRLCEKSKKELQRKLEIERNNLTSTTTPVKLDSHFNSTMVEGYQKCSEIRGRGAMARWMDTIRNYLQPESSPCPFKRTRDKAIVSIIATATAILIKVQHEAMQAYDETYGLLEGSMRKDPGLLAQLFWGEEVDDSAAVRESLILRYGSIEGRIKQAEGELDRLVAVCEGRTE